MTVTPVATVPPYASRAAASAFVIDPDPLTGQPWRWPLAQDHQPQRRGQRPIQPGVDVRRGCRATRAPARCETSLHLPVAGSAREPKQARRIG